MYAWGPGLFVDDKISMFSDADGSFTQWMDQEIDLSVAAMGHRSNRYSMLVENGVVLELNAENSPSDVKVPIFSEAAHSTSVHFLVVEWWIVEQVSDARTMGRCVHRFMPTNHGYVY